jgi:hypothetical protein
LTALDLARRDWGTNAVLLADLLAALGVVVLAWLYLGLGTEGFLLLTGITLALALIVGLLLRVSTTTPKGIAS